MVTSVFMSQTALEPWCHECTTNDYDDYLNVPLAPMLSPRSSIGRPSSPSSVTRFPTKCGVSGSPPKAKQRDSRKHVRDLSSASAPLTPLFLLDAFQAEEESASSGETSSTSDSKSVRFAFPLVSSVKECPARQSNRKEKEILFYTAGDIRRFKKERRQIKFLCRMAGFAAPSFAEQQLMAATSSPTDTDDSSSDDEDDEATSSSTSSNSTSSQKGMDSQTGRTSSRNAFVSTPPPSRRRRKKDDDKVLCTQFSKILLQDLFLLHHGLFDVASQ